MSLEDLIDEVRRAGKACRDLSATHSEEDYDTCQGLADAKNSLLDFVLDHANDLIAWERAHAARMSFDDYEIGT